MVQTKTKIKKGMAIKKVQQELSQFTKSTRLRIKDTLARRLRNRLRRRMKQADAMANALQDMEISGVNYANIEISGTKSQTCEYLETQVVAYYEDEVGMNGQRCTSLPALRRAIQCLEDGDGINGSSGGASSSTG